MRGERSAPHTEARSGDASANRSSGGRIERGDTRDSNRDARVSGSNRESRQPERDPSDGQSVSRDRDSNRTYDRNSDNGARSTDRANGGARENDRNRGRGNDRGRNDGWNNNRSNDRHDSWRGDHRSRGGSYGSHHYGNRTPHYSHGRVSRISPWNGGYRVWIGGGHYPFFVPLSHWRHDRFRVGFDIRIGGYYNSLGYYDYYDPYYNDADTAACAAVSPAFHPTASAVAIAAGSVPARVTFTASAALIHASCGTPPLEITSA